MRTVGMYTPLVIECSITRERPSIAQQISRPRNRVERGLEKVVHLVTLLAVETIPYTRVP